MTIKKSLLTVFLWVAAAMVFNIGIFVYFAYFDPQGSIMLGQERALEFLGGYVIEQSLSIDNLFLFLLIFSSFHIKPEYQKRVLTYGIMGAVVLRLIFILVGISVVERFDWILYIFGAVLIFSGIKMAIHEDKQSHNYKNNFIVKLLKKIIPVKDTINSNHFFVRENNILYATPLLVVLLIIETSDIIFAIDSIPAIFSITTNAFIVYTSNIFAIIGLRSMYIILEKIHKLFKYVKYGVALILVFTGIKLAVLMIDIHIPTLVSIGIIFIILLISIIASLTIKTNKEKHA